MGKHISGNKITSTHTSVTDLAQKVVKVLNKNSLVNKITLGVIKPNLKAGQHRIKILPTLGGCRLSVRSTTSLQHIYVYCACESYQDFGLESSLGIEVNGVKKTVKA